MSARPALPAGGEVRRCELPDVARRPVVVLSRDVAIPRLRRTVIAPCTTTIRGLPSEVLLEPSEDRIPRASVVNLDSMESVSVGALTQRLGRLSDQRMRQICAAVNVAVDCVGRGGKGGHADHLIPSRSVRITQARRSARTSAARLHTTVALYHGS